MVISAPVRSTVDMTPGAVISMFVILDCEISLLGQKIPGWLEPSGELKEETCG
jgi:hypothetical protein